MENLKKEINDFINEFNSICIASLSKDNEVMCSYAPL
ncbi:TPA: HugZ family heme oxygenase, partial [Campylobacter lari]|nr:HugZ family heme oxygenase [Campylobacter lari]